MKFFFIGTVQVSYYILKRLIHLDENIVGVATKKISKFNADFSDLSSLCIPSGIIYKYVPDINPETTVKWIKSLNPDLIICVGWSQIICKEILNIPKKGTIGFHPAAIPQNRGRHPLIWALFLGLKRSASTFFFMNKGIDNGDIISQKFFNISRKDNAGSLYKKIVNLAANQIENILIQIKANKLKRIKQNNKKANYWRKRHETDGRIDFRMTSEAIYNLVRALDKPYAGAHIEYKEKSVKVWKVHVKPFPHKNIEPGRILKSKNNSFCVITYDGMIEIHEHEFKLLPKAGEYL